MSFDLDKLKTFHTIVGSKSFSDAAKKVHLSPSAISRHIIELENSLGTRLFNRHARGLVLTYAGEILFLMAQEMMDKIDKTKSLLRNDHVKEAGVVRIATTHALAIWLSQYLNEFCALYPNIEIQVIANDHQLDLNSREADVSIRTQIPHQIELKQNYLTSFHLQIYASEAYLKKYGKPTEPSQLKEHKLLVFGNDVTHPYENINWLLHVGLDERLQEQPRKPFLRINSPEALKLCAENGLGIVALSREHVAMKKTNLVPILVEYVGPKVDLFYIYPKSLGEIKRFHVFGEFLESRLQTDKPKKRRLK